MGKLIYSAIASLDGYIADRDGKFEWAAPDEEVHAFVNDLERPIGTYLYGRRMYEVMVAWETMTDEAPVMRDFADIWRGGREDRLLDDARDGVQRAHADRAPVRPEGDQPHEGDSRAGHLRSAVPSWPRRRYAPGWSTSGTCSSRR